MKVTVTTPIGQRRTGTADKVSFEGTGGYRSFLERHVDCVSGLVPGVLEVAWEDEKETYAAVDEGIVIKIGDRVSISTRQMVWGTELGSLERAVEEQILKIGERRKRTRSALARLERDFSKSIYEYQKASRETG